jgi:hypothetical protein
MVVHCTKQSVIWRVQADSAITRSEDAAVVCKCVRCWDATAIKKIKKPYKTIMPSIVTKLTIVTEKSRNLTRPLGHQ